jgi:hypothetical protein
MRNTFLLLSFLFVGCVGAMAQNKTLGVGVVTPNPNAVLHVESPTGNQGFIMPRLSTAQRTSISPLSVADVGLTVYDTDAKNIFMWDGTVWKNTNNGIAGSTGRYAVTNATDTTTALSVKSSGLGNKGSAASFISTNTAGGTKPTVYINNAAGTGLSAETAAGWAIIGRVTAGFGNAVSGYTTSSDPGSWGGNFTAQTGTAVYASTASNVGGVLAPVAVYGESTGTGSVGGAFWIQNAANPYPALYAKTIGTGPAFRAETASGSAVVEATHTGTNGSAGSFEITTPSNASAGVYSETIGTGAAVYGKNTGGGNGFGGLFEVESATNTFPAIQARTLGTGPAIRAFKGISDAGSGPGIDVLMLNPAATASGFIVEQKGSGDGGFFNIDNASSSNAAVKARATNAGGGAGAFEIFNALNTKDAIFAITQGTGAAGSFNITNTSNTNNALRATTNGTGTTFLANHAGVSGDVAVFQSASSNVARIDKTGKGFFNNGTQASGADVAEMFDIEGARGEYEPGDVLIISESTDRTVEKSNAPNSNKVAGVYATKPGVVLTEKSIEENLDALVPMGVVGVIPTKVCLENGPIKRGDLLVTSSIKGHAMKAISKNNDGIFPAGVIIGKALENFDSGTSGLIKVLVNVK